MGSSVRMPWPACVNSAGTKGKGNLPSVSITNSFVSWCLAGPMQLTLTEYLVQEGGLNLDEVEMKFCNLLKG